MQATHLQNFSLNNIAGTVVGWLQKHPLVYKIIVFAAILFRTAMMTVFMSALPFSFGTNIFVGFTFSLGYRLALEGGKKGCPFKLTLPVFVGSVAYQAAHATLIKIFQGVAVPVMAALIHCSPLLLWTLSIVVIAQKNVEEKIVSRCGYSTTDCES